MKLATPKDFKGKTALLTATAEVELGNGEKLPHNFGSIFDLPVEGTKYNVQGFLGMEGSTLSVFGYYEPKPGLGKPKAGGEEGKEKPALKLFVLPKGSTEDKEKMEYCAAFKQKSGEGKKAWFRGKANGRVVNFFAKG